MQRIKHKLDVLEKHGGIRLIDRVDSSYGDEEFIITAVDGEKFLL